MTHVEPRFRDQENPSESGDGGLLAAVDDQPSPASSHKMEVLLFSLGTQEVFGINVLKIKEICRPMPITRTPNMPSGVEGFVSLRGHILPVLSLDKVIGVNTPEAGLQSTMMVTEFSRHILGFMVHGVGRIVRVDLDKVQPAGGMLADNRDMVAAIAELPNGKLVSVLDVEQILANAFGEAVVGHV